ncbi:hypothetical protein Syun_009644 [Stephania yunnanensis]|uniref:Uncharacterized protein n=1 Tax=Stephania yunnanensis TaxID=152371 RepID=A0AAP0KHI9_9MAGN
MEVQNQQPFQIYQDKNLSCSTPHFSNFKPFKFTTFFSPFDIIKKRDQASTIFLPYQVYQ